MAKSVDGFTPRRRIPADKPLLTPAKPPLQIKKPGHAYVPGQTGRSMDGIMRTQPARLVQKTWEERPRVGFDRPEFIRDPVLENKPETKASKFRKFLALTQYPLSALFLIIAIYSTSVGQWFVLAYAVYALIRGVQSRNTFIAALLLLIAIPVFQLLNQPGVADNIAIYAYELLVVGTVQTIAELIKDRKHKQSMVQ
jgi:hypothetical protein